MRMPTLPTFLKYCVLVVVSLLIIYLAVNVIEKSSKKNKEALNATLRNQFKHYTDSVDKASRAIIKNYSDSNALLQKDKVLLLDSISSIQSQIADNDNQSSIITQHNNAKVIYVTRLSDDDLARFITDRYRADTTGQ